MISKKPPSPFRALSKPSSAETGSPVGPRPKELADQTGSVHRGEATPPKPAGRTGTPRVLPSPGGRGRQGLMSSRRRLREHPCHMEGCCRVLRDGGSPFQWGEASSYYNLLGFHWQNLFPAMSVGLMEGDSAEHSEVSCTGSRAPPGHRASLGFSDPLPSRAGLAALCFSPAIAAPQLGGSCLQGTVLHPARSPTARSDRRICARSVQRPGGPSFRKNALLGGWENHIYTPIN